MTGSRAGTREGGAQRTGVETRTREDLAAREKRRNRVLPIKKRCTVHRRRGTTRAEESCSARWGFFVKKEAFASAEAVIRASDAQVLATSRAAVDCGCDSDDCVTKQYCAQRAWETSRSRGGHVLGAACGCGDSWLSWRTGPNTKQAEPE